MCMAIFSVNSIPSYPDHLASDDVWRLNHEKFEKSYKQLKLIPPCVKIVMK